MANLFLNPGFETADGDAEGKPASWSFYVSTERWGIAPFSGPYPFTEAFEYGYGDNEDWLASWAALVAAAKEDMLLFDSGAEYVEDYEELWDDNETGPDEWSETAPEDAVFDAAGDAFEDYEEQWPNRHLVADLTGLSPHLPENDSETMTALNTIKAKINTHRQSTVYHKVADTTNEITSPDATDESSTVTLANELWSKVWNHIVDGSETWHNADTVRGIYQMTLGEYPAADYGDAQMLALVLVAGLKYHLDWGNNARTIAAFEDLGATQPADLYSTVLLDSASQTNYDSGWGNDALIQKWSEAGGLFHYFTSATGTEDFESYEEKLPISVPLSTGAGGERDVDPSHGFTMELSGSWVAEVAFETQTANSSVWVEQGSLTNNGTFDIGPGFTKVRTYVKSYGSGAPTCTVNWTNTNPI